MANTGTCRSISCQSCAFARTPCSGDGPECDRCTLFDLKCTTPCRESHKYRGFEHHSAPSLQQELHVNRYAPYRKPQRSHSWASLGSPTSVATSVWLTQPTYMLYQYNDVYRQITGKTSYELGAPGYTCLDLVLDHRMEMATSIGHILFNRPIRSFRMMQLWCIPGRGEVAFASLVVVDRDHNGNMVKISMYTQETIPGDSRFQAPFIMADVKLDAIGYLGDNLQAVQRNQVQSCDVVTHTQIDNIKGNVGGGQLLFVTETYGSTDTASQQICVESEKAKPVTFHPQTQAPRKQQQYIEASFVDPMFVHEQPEIESGKKAKSNSKPFYRTFSSCTPLSFEKDKHTILFEKDTQILPQKESTCCESVLMPQPRCTSSLFSEVEDRALLMANSTEPLL